ncbi:hypothetical protein SK128_005643 [Halocaridina rubra]|uniref:C2H2-type domain-containing protein n=1 Tax=Halocaridina rubra TaxID=373956 RepID=A0AAN8ZY33_HALRR
MRVHTKERPFKCMECGQGFANKSTLHTHLRTHTLEKPYTCTECGRSFSVKSTLTAHMRLHTQERPYTCSVCGKSFSQKSALNTHMRVHTEEKPYTCSVCGTKFSQSCHLNRHMKIHIEGRPYVNKNGECFGPQKNVDSLNLTSGNDKSLAVSADNDKSSQNDESPDTFASPENDDTPDTDVSYDRALKASMLCVQTLLEHDPEMSSDIFSSDQENEDAVVCSRKKDVVGEFVNIKEELVLPENDDERMNRVSVLEGFDDNSKSLGPEPQNLDFLNVKTEVLSDNEGN